MLPMKEHLTQAEVIVFLKNFQKNHKLSLTEFAKKLGVSPQYLNGIYSGDQLPSEKVRFKKIAAFVQTGDFDDLVHS